MILELPGYFGWFAFCFGAIIGSFLNVVVWRVPRGMSLNTPPSTCPNCGHRILPWENIPIISWLCLRGKCSGCHKPISWKYPAGEAAVGVLFWLIWRRVQIEMLPLETLLGCWWLAGAILSLARIDFERHVLPNLVTYSGLIAALLFAVVLPLGRPALFAPGLLHSGAIVCGKLLQMIYTAVPNTLGIRLAATADCVTGAALGALIVAIVRYLGGLYLRRLKRRGEDNVPDEAMGLGDLKMMTMIGAFLGVDAVIYITAVGSLLACVWSLIFRGIAPQKVSLYELPFAPFVAIPTLVWLICWD